MKNRIKEVELIHERLKELEPRRVDQGKLLGISDLNVPKWLDSLSNTITRLKKHLNKVGKTIIIVDL